MSTCVEPTRSTSALHRYRSCASQGTVGPLEIFSNNDKPSGQYIQKRSQLKLWLALVNFDRNLARLEKNIISLAADLEQLGMTRANIFIAGHGEAGISVQRLANRNPQQLSGIILLGSLLQNGTQFEYFGMNVLTVAGDLDGVTRVTQIAQTFKVLSQEVEKNRAMQYKAPMVIVKGINHGSFSNDILQEDMKRYDLTAELPIRKSQRLIARYISLFLSYTIRGSRNKKQRERMSKWFRKTTTFLQPILEMEKMELNRFYQSQWLNNAQIWLSGLGGNDTQFLRVKSYSVEENVGISPDLYIRDNNVRIVYVTLFFYLKRCEYQSDTYSHLAHSPTEIRAFMLSQKRIQSHFYNVTSVRDFTCRDLNYAAFVTALSKVPPEVLKRYYGKHKGAIFHEDIHINNENEWWQRKLLVNTTEHEQHVTAYLYETEVESAGNEVEEGGEGGGFFYCTLLPPSRVMEWIYVDALRNSYNSEINQRFC
uniref:Alpha/beta hydrolase fold-5 domain-containing protein n=1 Tax=Octopus bimaculoides TaxID=37653 RepID=A0A0L8GP09_OCTBM